MSSKVKGRIFYRTQHGRKIGSFLIATNSTKYSVCGISTTEKINPLYESHTEFMFQKAKVYFPKTIFIRAEKSTCVKIAKYSFAKELSLRFVVTPFLEKQLSKFEDPYDIEVAEFYSNTGYKTYATVRSVVRFTDTFTREKYILVTLNDCIYEKET